MQRTYGIFERFPNGCLIWRATVPGQFEAERKLQELTEYSENEFFAIDLSSRELLAFNSHEQIANRVKRVA